MSFDRRFGGEVSDSTGTVTVEIKPDYDQDFSVENTYLSIAISILKASQTIDIFSVPRSSIPSNMIGLPSWVPDWSVSEAAHSLLLPTLGGEQAQYRATSTSISAPQPRFRPDGLEVQLCGQLIDSVYKVREVFRGNEVAPLPSEFISKGYKIVLDVFWESVKTVLF